MQQITIASYNAESTFALNKRCGLLYYQCIKCQQTAYHKEIYNSSLQCKCGGNLVSYSTVTMRKDCGCLMFRNIQPVFRMRILNRCQPLAKLYNLTDIYNQYHITECLYIKVGSGTNLHFNIYNANTIVRERSSNDSYINYVLHCRKDNKRMTINGIPCKLFYTEYTKSSYRGYFVTHIIALDYEFMNEHLQRSKLFRRINHDKNSLFSKLPKEIMSMIKHYNIARFYNIFRQWYIKV